MHKILILAALALLAASLSIRADDSVVFTDSSNYFDLICDDAHGDVVFSATGMPDGFIIDGNRIIWRGANAIQGQYPVEITAVDDAGQATSTIVLFNANLSGNLLGSINGLDISNAGLTQISLGGDSANINGLNGGQVSITSGSGSSSTGQVVTIDGQQVDLGQSVTLNVGDLVPRTTITRADVDSILSRYSVDSTVERNTEITSYPTPTILTGQLPTSSATQAQVLSIATTQADLTNGAVGKTTEYDRNITHYFNKQTQVSQTIANLLNIIRKGTANRDKAQADIDHYRLKYQEAVQVHDEISIQISQKESKVKGIKGAISEAEAELTKYRVDLKDLDDKIGETKASGLTLTHDLSVVLANKDGLDNQIASTKTTIDSLSVRLDSQSANCDRSNGVVTSLQANISVLLASIAGIDQQVLNIDSNIDDYLAQIAALQAQIRVLNGKIDDAKVERQRLINLNFTVPQQVASLRAQIELQNAQCGNDNNVFIELTAARARLRDLEGQLTNNGNEIARINGRITIVRAELTDLTDGRNALIITISDLTASLRTLKLSLPTYESELSECYVRGNRALKLIESTNSSLTAASARLRIESDALTVANYHLQIARTEQQEISTKINLILQENTAGLPFPSAPSESGLTVEIGTVNAVDSINAFLLRAYGSSIHLNAFSQYAGGRYLYNFGIGQRIGCAPIIMSGSSLSSEAQANLMSLEGTILSILNDNEWIISTEQGEQTVVLDACTLRLANMAQYNASVGDLIAVKGRVEGGIWHASQITCFHG